MKEHFHTKKVCSQSELIVFQDLLARGFDVFKPIGDYTVIDVIAIKDHHVIRLEVKTNFDTSSDGVYWSQQRPESSTCQLRARRF